MTRISRRELRNNTAQVLENLEITGESQITHNGEPVAILSPLNLKPLERFMRSGQAQPPRTAGLAPIERVSLDRPSREILKEPKGDL